MGDGRAEEVRAIEGRGSKTVRILLVVLNSSYGGAEKHVHDLARYLDRGRFEVAVCCPPLSRLAKMLAALPGVRIFAAGPGLSAFRDLRRAVTEFRPAVVHLHSPRASLVGRLAMAAGRPRGTKVMSTVHGWIPGRLWLRGLYNFLYGVTGRLEDYTIAVSRDIERRLLAWGYRPDRVEVVYNGVDLPEEPPAMPSGEAAGLNPGEPAVAMPEEAAGQPLEGYPSEKNSSPSCLPEKPTDGFPLGRKLTFGFFGRLVLEKGIFVLLEAWRILQKEGRAGGCWLVVYGAGEQREKVQARMASYGLDGVCLKGELEPGEVLTRLGGVDVLVVPSFEEGFPYIVLEAMSLGRPAIASRVGGLPEMVEDGVTGWLVPPRDPRALAAAMERLVEEPARVDLAGQAAHGKAARFGLEEMVRRVEEIYLRLAGG